MIQFPLHFEVFAEADSDLTNAWKCQANALEPISCCIPPEFAGPGKSYTPEDFFAFSVINSIIAAFKIGCEKANQNFDKIKGKASLTMDLGPDNKLTFAALDICLDVTGASDKEKIKKILEEAISICPVSNAIKTPKTLHIQVN